MRYSLNNAARLPAIGSACQRPLQALVRAYQRDQVEHVGAVPRFDFPRAGLRAVLRFGVVLILASALVSLPRLSFAAVDLYMRDCPADTGIQPTPVGTCPDMWVTEDIWIRNDPIPSYAPQPYNPGAISSSHWTQQPGVLTTQSALYRDPKLGRPNYIYVRVRALGSGQSLGNEELHVYWAKAALSLAWPLQWKGPPADPDGYIDTLTTPPCPQLYLGDEITKPRRNGATASAQQRTRFIAAVNHLNTAKFYVNGTLSQSISYWDNQDQIHRYMPEHGNDAFNPWHRDYISRFEQLLKEYDPRVTLMYWDWTTDPSSTLSFMGSFSGRVGAPFAGLDNNNVCAGARRIDEPTDFCSPCVTCSGTLPYDFTLPPVTICRALNLSTAPAADTASLNQTTYPTFRSQLEVNAHNRAHPRLGGTQCSPAFSPQDPIFFFIHANNDRIWARWQRDQTLPSHSLDRMTSLDAYGGSTFCRLGDTIQPWDGRSAAWGAGCTPARTPVYPWSGAGFDSSTITLKQYRDASVVTPPIYDNVPLTIPRLNAGEEVILQIPWYPPNPAAYTCFSDSGHFCLLARIEQPGQPLLGMFSAETADINSNVRQNNNIVWKNISIVNPARASVLIRNAAGTLVPTRLAFTAESIQGLTVLNYGDILVDLGPELAARWNEGGAQSDGVERIAPGTIQLLKANASLFNIPLRSNDAFSVQVNFRLFDNYPHPGGNQYNLQFAQYGTPNNPNGVVGGQQFQFDFNKIRVIKPGSVWRYWDGGDPRGDWQFPGYDDSKWPSGAAELGYGNMPITVINSGQGSNVNVTAYFRQAFQVARPALFSQLLLRLKHDDGAVVYLNGQEIYRALMSQGFITPDTLATADVSGAREKAFITVDVSNALGLLQPGTNLLAVEVHQSFRGSDDLSFDLELCANPGDTALLDRPTVDFVEPVDAIYFLAGRPITLKADAFAADGQIDQVRFLDGPTELARFDSPPYTFIWTNPPVGKHAVCVIAERFGGSGDIKFHELRVVTNLHPVVQIVHPAYHAQFAQGTPVTVEAFASDDGGQVRRVSLFVKSAGEWNATPVLLGAMTMPPYPATAAGLMPGEYVAYAEAEDSAGAVQISGGIHFDVVAGGQLVFNFNDCQLPPGTSFPGVGNVGRIADDGTGSNCVVHLTDVNQANAFGVFLVPDALGAGHAESIHLHWRSVIGGDLGSVCNTTQFGRSGADGYSVSWGADLPNPPSYGNPGEEGAGSGLIVTVDTFDNGASEAPGLEVKWAGNRVAFDSINADPGLAKDFLRKNAFVEADVTVDAAGQVIFRYDGRFLTATLPNWAGIHGGDIMFAARTGGACDNHWIDDLLIEPYKSAETPCGQNLKITRSGNSVVITWEGGGVLQSTINLSSPEWATVSGNPNGSYLIPPAGSARFFRVSCAPASLSIGRPGVNALDATTLLTAIPVINSGTTAAENIQVTAITLDNGALLSPALPANLGAIPMNGSTVLNADFIGGPFVSGASHTLTVSGTYFSSGATRPFTLSAKILIPRSAPGEAAAASVSVGANQIAGAPFPPQPRPPRNLDLVNGLPWKVPTGPFVPGTPTPSPSGVAEIPGLDPDGVVAAGAGPVVFLANNGLGLTSGPFNGTASSIAEPSGARSANGVVFATANWVAAFSTDNGGTFTQLDPTTIFPADAVGFCCDQIVQYVPRIDRFIWLIQGNGYRLAVASPADVANSGGTAWTYWNLTPQLFGQPNGTGLDYPDLSVGDNFLYMSWDAGFGCPAGCRQGFQVARTSLAGLRAGGTITIEFTDPPNAVMAWGSHLVQNTGNEIFWAGHNNNSQMRVFSWAEGSGVYFWRDIGISTWANNALSSLTPDGQNWLAGSGGFPGNAVIGGARSASQIWFAWNAGTDNRFQQPHVEMVTLDRNNNFNRIQQVQIWNNSYAFGYPALSTHACTGEIGLSLEWGGGGNYQNHVVGFWGDFLVYITSASNVGTTRFGDYVTIRQAPPTQANPGNLFAAFGYGLNSVAPPGTGTTTDIRYVLFGRPATTCIIGR